MIQTFSAGRRQALATAPVAMLGLAAASESRARSGIEPAAPRARPGIRPVELAPRAGLDPFSQAVLRQPLLKIDAGQGLFADRVHQSFPRIIEQNFALRGPNATAMLLDGLTELELADLATLYTVAGQSQGGAQRLLPVLVHRLDDDRLVRVSQHFGFEPTYAALSAIHPHRTSRFAQRADRHSPVPQIDRLRSKISWRPDAPAPVRPEAGLQKVGFVKTSSISKYLHYTPLEIYLDFRTAPVGSLSVAGALWEASTVMSFGLGRAFAGGYAFGTVVVEPLVRNYAPKLYERVGKGVADSVEWLTRSWSGTVAEQADAQRFTAPRFESTSLQLYYFGLGGDFGVSSSWGSLFSSGGGCHPICIDLSN